MTGVSLQWDGKTTAIPNLVLPLQVVEAVNKPRADRGTIFEAGETGDGWSNRLIWGDNQHALTSLRGEFAGKIDLIYIDPPFDSRQDYRVEVGVGTAEADADYSKLQSVIEEKAYRDTWGAGRASYLQMLLTRLLLCRDLLSDTGSIVVHMDWHQGHYAKLLLDEVFGEKNFRNELVWWYYNKYQGNINRFSSNHDVLLWYSKGEKYTFNKQKEKREAPVKQLVRVWDKEKRSLVNAKDPVTGKVLYQTSTDKTVDDVWRVSMLQPADRTENVRYETQKPLSLAKRVVGALSNEGDLVLDCFVGSGTTAVAAEQLKRRWIGIDIGRFAIHTTRKRLLEIPGCSPFLLANSGRYERQHWQSVSVGPEYEAYLTFIVELYGAKSLSNANLLHGTSGRGAVHVGAVDAPVGAGEITDALDEAKAGGFGALDVLGWEFELGLNDVIHQEALARGLQLRLRRIPNEVMDARAVEQGGIVFHELAYVRLASSIKNRRDVHVRLEDFMLPNPELVPASARSKITSWSDYIDYWAVDFTYGSEGSGEPDTFRNQWQSYRTRNDRSLELEATHSYDDLGPKTVMVKVVDIFGNDTTTVVRVDLG